MDKIIKRIAFGSSLLLALATPLYAQTQDPNKEAEEPGVEITLEEGFESIEKRINSLEQTVRKELKQLKTNHGSIDKQIKEMNTKVNKISEPHWYSGPLGYALASVASIVGLLIGAAGLFGYDHFKKRKRIKAYNKVAEDYFKDENFDWCIRTLESAIVINPIDQETKYNLIDALINEEDNLIRNNQDRNKQEKLLEILRRISTEIKALKNCDEKDFTPYLFEGHRFYFEGDRETEPNRRKEKFAQAFEKYEEAKGKYKSKKLGRYYVGIKVKGFKRKHPKLNDLYKTLGYMLMEGKNYKEALDNLKIALIYNKNDEKTLDLFKECEKKQKTQNLNTPKTTYIKGGEK